MHRWVAGPGHRPLSAEPLLRNKIRAVRRLQRCFRGFLARRTFFVCPRLPLPPPAFDSLLLGADVLRSRPKPRVPHGPAMAKCGPMRTNC